MTAIYEPEYLASGWFDPEISPEAWFDEDLGSSGDTWDGIVIPITVRALVGTRPRPALVTISTGGSAGTGLATGTTSPVNRTRTGTLTSDGQAFGLLEDMTTLNIVVTMSCSATYYPPIELPSDPTLPDPLPADPVQATGYLIRPLMGVLLEPQRDPVIVNGRPT